MKTELFLRYDGMEGLMISMVGCREWDVLELYICMA
jgi:hypothetical protein